MADLEIAIQRYEEALDTTPADHPDRARRLKSLGIGYHDRYQRTGAITDLEIAIQRFQEALDATPADHPDRANRLQDLGIGYRDRYQRTGAITDLEMAIQRIQEALDATSADHPDRANRLRSLGIGYRDRYQRTGAIIDLEMAIQRFQEALHATSADHPDRADQLRHQQEMSRSLRRAFLSHQPSLYLAQPSVYQSPVANQFAVEVAPSTHLHPPPNLSRSVYSVTYDPAKEMSDHPDSGYHSGGSFGDEGRTNKRAPDFEGGSENVIFPQIPNHFLPALSTEVTTWETRPLIRIPYSE
jgi:tetratricopeptide (TPR) repeat protein